jgi:hypothetical protein
VVYHKPLTPGDDEFFDGSPGECHAHAAVQGGLA